MKRIVLATLMLAGGTAIAQGPPPAPKPETLASRPDATGGEALYVEHCLSCHGPNGMGTGLLARRVQPPLLEARGEVGDDELRQIAEYLAAGPHPAAPGAAQ